MYCASLFLILEGESASTASEASGNKIENPTLKIPLRSLLEFHHHCTNVFAYCFDKEKFN